MSLIGGEAPWKLSLNPCMYVCMYVFMYVHNIISTGSLLIVADPIVRIGLKVCMYVCMYVQYVCTVCTCYAQDNKFIIAITMQINTVRMYVDKYCMYIYVHVCTSIK